MPDQKTAHAHARFAPNTQRGPTTLVGSNNFTKRLAETKASFRGRIWFLIRTSVNGISAGDTTSEANDALKLVVGWATMRSIWLRLGLALWLSIFLPLPSNAVDGAFPLPVLLIRRLICLCHLRFGGKH